jgi:hypothetical protein
MKLSFRRIISECRQAAIAHGLRTSTIGYSKLLPLETAEGGSVVQTHWFEAAGGLRRAEMPKVVDPIASFSAFFVPERTHRLDLKAFMSKDPLI